MYKVLLADDSVDIADMMALYLESDGYAVTVCNDGLTAIQKIREQKPDLLVLDIMMPGLNGYELIKKVRQESTVPILMVSAKNGLSEKILALDLGADDFITKPFEPMELVSRVRAAIRRTYGFADADADIPKVLEVDALRLDPSSYECTLQGENIALTPLECRILEMFMQQPGRVFTREQIYEAGWQETCVDDNAIQVAISKLRQKIGEASIRTVRGLGYKLEKKHGKL